MTRPVGSWDLSLTVSSGEAGDEAQVPLSLRISRAVIADIRRGRLRPGGRLPGTRTLARTLSVNRNTVVAAYTELAAEGWIDASEASGTFVSRSLPEVRPRRFSAQVAKREEVPVRLGFDLEASAPLDLGTTAGPASGVIVMSGALPDVRLFPVAQLARAYRRVLRQSARSVLSYGHPQGHPRLRVALAAMLATTRGLATGPDDVLVTGGSQMALDLVGRTLLRPGDVVAVEAKGYRPAWEVFRRYGAELVAVPIDQQGLRVEDLEALAERRPIRAVYVTPHHQYPTTVTLTAARRLALLGLAKRKRIAIVEDDFDHEFHYEGRPVLPLASVDQVGVVVYLGTLSKLLAPGLRLGYVAAPRPLLEALAAQRLHVDRQGDHAVECAVAELLEDGEVQRHARRVRRIYQARRDFLVERLRAQLGPALAFEPPPGGMALWAKAGRGVDVDAWSTRALGHKLVFYSAKRFAFDGRARPYLRLGFAALNEGEIEEAVRRLRSAL